MGSLEALCHFDHHIYVYNTCRGYTLIRWLRRDCQPYRCSRVPTFHRPVTRSGAGTTRGWQVSHAPNAHLQPTVMAHWRPPTLADLGDRSFDSEEESSSGSAGTRSRRTSLLSESISELDYYDEDSSDEELDGQRPLKRARWDEPTTEASSSRVPARDPLAPPFLECRFGSPLSRAQSWHWWAHWTRYYRTGT